MVTSILVITSNTLSRSISIRPWIRYDYCHSINMNTITVCWWFWLIIHVIILIVIRMVVLLRLCFILLLSRCYYCYWLFLTFILLLSLILWFVIMKSILVQVEVVLEVEVVVVVAAAADRWWRRWQCCCWGWCLCWYWCWCRWWWLLLFLPWLKQDGQHCDLHSDILTVLRRASGKDAEPTMRQAMRQGQTARQKHRNSSYHSADLHSATAIWKIYWVYLEFQSI